MASNYWGISRTTHDLDFVIQLPRSAVTVLVEAFRSDFHIDELGSDFGCSGRIGKDRGGRNSAQNHLVHSASASARHVFDFWPGRLTARHRPLKASIGGANPSPATNFRKAGR